MYSILNIDNNVVLSVCNVKNIHTRATVLQYIHVSKWHAVHLKFTHCDMSHLFNF